MISISHLLFLAILTFEIIKSLQTDAGVVEGMNFVKNLMELVSFQWQDTEGVEDFRQRLLTSKAQMDKNTTRFSAFWNPDLNYWHPYRVSSKAILVFSLTITRLEVYDVRFSLIYRLKRATILTCMPYSMTSIYNVKIPKVTSQK